MFSPLRTDAEPIKVKLRDMYLVIPANCFDSPLQPEAPDDHGYTVDPDVLLVMLLPDLACRTRENRARFSITGEDAPILDILVDSFGPAIDHKAALGRIFDDVAFQSKTFRQNPGYEATPLKLIGSTPGEQIYEMSRLESVGGSRVRVVFYRRTDGTAFTECIIRTERNLVSSCDQYILYLNKSVKLHFGYGFAAQRDSIRERVIEKLDGFRRTASGD